MFPKSTPLFIKLLTFLRYNNTRIQQGPAPLVVGPPPPPCYLFALVKSIWKGGGREPRHIDLSQAYSSMEEGREGTENVIMEIWKIYLVSAITPPPPPHVFPCGCEFCAQTLIELNSLCHIVRLCSTLGLILYFCKWHMVKFLRPSMLRVYDNKEQTQFQRFLWIFQSPHAGAKMPTTVDSGEG